MLVQFWEGCSNLFVVVVGRVLCGSGATQLKKCKQTLYCSLASKFFIMVFGFKDVSISAVCYDSVKVLVVCSDLENRFSLMVSTTQCS